MNFDREVSYENGELVLCMFSREKIGITCNSEKCIEYGN